MAVSRQVRRRLERENAKEQKRMSSPNPVPPPTVERPVFLVRVQILDQATGASVVPALIAHESKHEMLAAASMQALRQLKLSPMSLLSVAAQLISQERHQLVAELSKARQSSGSKAGLVAPDGSPVALATEPEEPNHADVERRQAAPGDLPGGGDLQPAS